MHFKAHSFFISGQAGQIEAICNAQPGQYYPHLAILCHPHPLHGGSMQNKVVTTLAKTFQELSIPSLRFNFRGVGKSEGSYGEGLGEWQDMQSVIAWVRQNYPDTSLSFAGFSFGAYIAAQAASQMPADLLIMITPAIEHADYENLAPFTCPAIIVSADDDEVVNSTAILNWHASRKPEAKLIRFEKAGHFFHGQLIELKEILLQHIQDLEIYRVKS